MKSRNPLKPLQETGAASDSVSKYQLLFRTGLCYASQRLFSVCQNQKSHVPGIEPRHIAVIKSETRRRPDVSELWRAMVEIRSFELLTL